MSGNSLGRLRGWARAVSRFWASWPGPRGRPAGVGHALLAHGGYIAAGSKVSCVAAGGLPGSLSLVALSAAPDERRRRGLTSVRPAIDLYQRHHGAQAEEAGAAWNYEGGRCRRQPGRPGLARPARPAGGEVVVRPAGGAQRFSGHSAADAGRPSGTCVPARRDELGRRGRGVASARARRSAAPVVPRVADHGCASGTGAGGGRNDVAA